MKPLFLSTLICLLLIGSAHAERADRDQPIYLEADRATVEDVKKKDSMRVSIFTGNVIMTQGTLRITADKVILREDIDGFRYATATGNLVTFRQKRDGIDEYIEGWSERAEYDNKSEKIELFKQARLKRGEDEVKGDYIAYNITTEFFQVIGNHDRNGETQDDNRVRIIFQPKNKSNGSDNTDPPVPE